MEQQDINPGEKSRRFFLRLKKLNGGKGKIITLNKKLLIFSFFLLLSVVFWFLTALNKDYISTLSYPVKYIRFPKGKVLVNDVPERLDLNVESRGFTLLRFKLKSRLVPIVFDVNSFSLNTISEKEPLTVYILTDYAVEKIQQQLSAEINVLSISPDSLIFQFTDVHSKNVGVHVNLSLSFEKQYMQTGAIEINPDSVVVSGPGVIVDTIKSVETEDRSVTGIKKNINLDLNLQQIKKVEFSIDQIRVMVPVDKFTEGKITIPIIIINFPDSLYLRMFPDDVEITYRAGLNDYGKVNEHMFQAVVDYADKENNIGNKLKVNIVKSPEYVTITDFHPKNIEYIIEK